MWNVLSSSSRNEMKIKCWEYHFIFNFNLFPLFRMALAIRPVTAEIHIHWALMSDGHNRETKKSRKCLELTETEMKWFGLAASRLQIYSPLTSIKCLMLTHNQLNWIARHFPRGKNQVKCVCRLPSPTWHAAYEQSNTFFSSKTKK